MALSKLKVFEILHAVQHPAENKDVVELNMIQNLKITDTELSFDLVFPSIEKTLNPQIKKACFEALQAAGVAHEIKITPKINERKEEGNRILSNVKNIVAVSSGKGGVGKSTVAANLAVALAQTGLKVGLADADIYGPSVPKMFGSEDARPDAISKNGRDMLQPVEKYGVKLLSIGYFVDPDKATIWRGPMASNVMKQLTLDGDWGELDFLLIDLPPGTSDIHLTMVQNIPVTGAVIVSTPQDVALADASKGISMFRSENINVPVLGLVENMAWFTPAELPENKYFIFGKEGGKRLAAEYNIPLLGQIPIVQGICESGDSGKPIATDVESITGKAFAELADKVIAEVDRRNKELPATEVVKVNKL